MAGWAESPDSDLGSEPFVEVARALAAAYQDCLTDGGPQRGVLPPRSRLVLLRVVAQRLVQPAPRGQSAQWRVQRAQPRGERVPVTGHAPSPGPPS